MKVLSKVGVLQVFLLTFAHVFFSASVQEKDKFQVSVSLYEIPNMVISRIVSSKIAADGSVTGAMTWGDITSSFPAGVVLLQTAIPSSYDDSAAIKMIKAHMATNCIRLQDISVSFLARDDLLLDTMEPEGQEIDRDFKSGGIERHCRLKVVPKWQGEELACLGLQFWMNRKNPNAIQLIGVETPAPKLLDMLVAAKFDQALLIGFPSFDQKPRGTVYWLQVFLEKSS